MKMELYYYVLLFVQISIIHNIFPIFQTREGEKGVTLKNPKNRRGLYHLMSETVNPSMLRKLEQC